MEQANISTYRGVDLQEMEALTGRILVQAWMRGNVCQRCLFVICMMPESCEICC